MEPGFEKTVQQLAKLKLLNAGDIELLQSVDSVCARLSVSEFDAYVERRFNPEGLEILAKAALWDYPSPNNTAGKGWGC